MKPLGDNGNDSKKCGGRRQDTFRCVVNHKRMIIIPDYQENTTENGGDSLIYFYSSTRIRETTLNHIVSKYKKENLKSYL